MGGLAVLSLGARTVLRARKYVYQSLSPSAAQQPQRIVFIFGCQRSGTTLMQHIFDRDLDAKVYGEFSPAVYGRYAETASPGSARHFRLKPLDEVKAVFERDRARLIVVKPIVETQNAPRVLGFFPGAKALFLYRHYAAVAASNLKNFGRANGISDLRPIVLGEAANWRAEGVAPEVRALVTQRFRDDMNPYDAAALFWYVRNRFFFDLALDRHAAVKPFKYEQLVQDPSGMVERVYRFVGKARPPASDTLVRGEPRGKAGDVRLTPDVEALCAELLARLDRAFAASWAHA
jgi:hypothetical protein